MKKNRYFEEALADLVNNAAYGDAVRHLADLGLTVPEIHDRLMYPVSNERISAVVWKHLVSRGIILTEEPDGSGNVKTTYIKETDELGRTSFRRMEESVPPVAGSFAICDFGKKIYQDKKAFDRELECLDQCDRDYISYLDWPLRKVYHVMDERMKRIAAKLDLEVVSFGNVMSALDIYYTDTDIIDRKVQICQINSREQSC